MVQCRRSGGLGCLIRVYQVAKLLGRFEVGNPLGRNLHAFACFWVSSNAGIALANAKGPEATNLNLVSALQSSDHGPKDGFNNDLTVASSQIAQSCDLLHQVCFC